MISMTANLIRPALRQAVKCSRCISSTSRSFAPAAAAGPSTSSTSSSTSSKPKAAKRPVSSCLPGTTLTGLSILKDQPDPVALPDDQYPAWLWTILDTEKASALGDEPSGLGSGSQGEIDFKREKKRLRALNKANIKASNYLKTT